MSWLPYALASAAFAGATAILSKIGVQGISSNLATAIRSVVIGVFAWTIVLVRAEHSTIRSLSSRNWIFLALSGVTTALSWLAYFRALQLGPASRVAPIDKLSLVFTIVLAILVLQETVSWRLVAGVALMCAGGLLAL